MLTLASSATSEIADSMISNALDSIVSTLVAMAPPLLSFAGAFIVLTGLLRVLRAARDPSQASGWPTVFFGALVGGSGFVLPNILRAVFGDPGTPEAAPVATAPSVTPSPDATPAQVLPSTTPPAATSPADLAWLWVALGCAVGLVLLVVLARVLMIVIGGVRRDLREAQARKDSVRAAESRLAVAWQQYRDRHSALLQKYLRAETDWDCLFYTPALTDPNVRTTAIMLRAMREAGNARDAAGDLPEGLAVNADLSDLSYPRAVTAFDVAWDAAERNARRIGQKGIPASERKVIGEIRTLLELAENGAASETERSLSYRRAQTLIASLQSVHVPEQALAQLEERHRLMLSADVPGNRSTSTDSEEQR